ncbi:MAG TPA: hypothetical protein VJJ54_05815 [Gemmatimonadales bacterium]|nr:hypothetical protein [Gemmatimonadales bacterium]
MTVPGLLARRGDVRALALSALFLTVGPPTRAQLISIKTVPVAQGDQFDIFPSQHQGMGGPSIALADTLLDPFRNPAKGARLAVPRFVSSPTFYGVSNRTGGGRTLPLAAFTQRGAWYGGLSLALQEIDPSQSQPPVSQPIGIAEPLRQFGPNPPPPTPPRESHGNAYAFALLGTTLPRPGVSLAASLSWARLNAVDGVDLLYPGSQGVDQFGHAVDVRLGLLKEWPGQRSLDAVLLHNRFGMAQNVTYSEFFWDPGSQRVQQRSRVQGELDHTNTWGLQLQYERPLAASGWRIGWVATGNLMSHPKLPNYTIMNIPRDPGHSHAYQLGIGVARGNGPATFGLDAVYEPIWSDTWAAAAAPTQTAGGDTIPLGGKTIENRFRFSNALLRMGIGREVTVGGRPRGAAWQLGLALRAVHYWLNQQDHVQAASRAQEEWWVEWTPSWGITVRFPELELRYGGHVTKGTGRPGVETSDIALADAAGVRAGGLLVAPSGPLTLQGVSVVTHQLSLSLPLH